MSIRYDCDNPFNRVVIRIQFFNFLFDPTERVICSTWRVKTFCLHALWPKNWHKLLKTRIEWSIIDKSWFQLFLGMKISIFFPM